VPRRSDSLARPLLIFAGLALVALTVVAVTGALVVRKAATDQALAEARQLTDLSARIVEQRVNDGLLTGDAETLGAVASVVFDAVKTYPIVRVKIWDRDGTILYSDQTELIGSTYDLGEDELEVIDHGGVVADVSDLSEPENRFEQDFGELLEVYTRIDTHRKGEGTPLLFETYQLASSIADRRRELTATFLPILVATLAALVLLMVPIAWILVRRVRASQLERERLMQRALDASEREQRRIAGDLHDGPVQEMAGLAMRLSAEAELVDDADAGITLRSSASAVRGSVRMLRSAIVEIYPPNLQQAGLPAALSDLVTGLDRHGIELSLEVEPDAGFGAEVDALLYRATQEALRNVEEHADARHVRVVITRQGGRAVLEVADDGRGIAPDALAEAPPRGHMGLAILGDMVSDAGGTLTVEPGAQAGTVVRVEVQAP